LVLERKAGTAPTPKWHRQKISPTKEIRLKIKHQRVLLIGRAKIVIIKLRQFHIATHYRLGLLMFDKRSFQVIID